MSYVSNAELSGIEKGILQGILKGYQEGAATLLTRQLVYKLNRIQEKYQQKIQHADVETLFVWGEKMLDAKSLEEVFE